MAEDQVPEIFTIKTRILSDKRKRNRDRTRIDEWSYRKPSHTHVKISLYITILGVVLISLPFPEWDYQILLFEQTINLWALIKQMVLLWLYQLPSRKNGIMAISGQSKWLHWVSNFQTGWPTKGIDLRTLNTIYGTPTSTPANQKTTITEMRNILESNIMF